MGKTGTYLKLKYIIILLLNILVVNIAVAQKVKGVIKDKIEGNPLPFVAIAAKNEKQELITGTLTGNDGKFEINLTDKVSFLTVEHLGYKEQIFKRPFPSNLVINLEAGETFLEELTVSGERTFTEIGIDKQVINFGEDLQTAGGNVLEAFQQLPQVQTDPISRQVKLRGNSNVRILINGKPSSMNNADLLEQINANRVDKVEIITSPSAKYQADGISGIINIILEDKIIKGINGAVGVEARTSPGYSVNANLTSGFKSFNIQGNISYRDFYHNNETDIQRNVLGNPVQQIFRANEYEGAVKNYDLKLDWFINPLNNMSVSLNRTNNTFYLSPVTTIQSEGTPFLLNELTNFHERLTTIYNLNYEKKFPGDKQRILNIDLDLNKNDNYLPSKAFTNGEVTLDNDLYNNNKILNSTTDLNWEVDAHNRIESGFLHSYKAIDNTLLDQRENITIESLFDYHEHTYAGYIQLKKDIGKTAIQVGLRSEYFLSQGNTNNGEGMVSRKFLNFFPSLHFNYQLNETIGIFLRYNKRITRPSFFNINPLTTRYNPLFRREGNPNLTPELTDNFEFVFKYIKGNFFLNNNLFYRNTSNIINHLYSVDTEGITILQFANGGKNEAIGLESTLSTPLSKSIELNITASGYYIRANPAITDFYFRSQFNYTVSSKLSYKALSKLSLDAQWNYEGMERTLNVTRRPLHFLNLAARYKTLKDKGTFSIQVTDFYKGIINRNTQESNQVIESLNWRGLTRMLMLSFNYRFQKGTIKRLERSKK